MLQDIFKVYVNGRVVKVFTEQDEAVAYAILFNDLLTDGDYIYVIKEKSEIVYEKRKEQNYVVG